MTRETNPSEITILQAHSSRVSRKTGHQPLVGVYVLCYVIALIIKMITFITLHISYVTKHENRWQDDHK
jgi:hypothetical protein